MPAHHGSHVVPPHPVVPLHALLPVQQIVLDSDEPLTLPPHDKPFWQFKKHEFVAVHVTSSLHDAKPVQSTRQSVPLHVTLPPHASTTPQLALHFCALHVMSLAHAPPPEQSIVHTPPPHWMVSWQELPPLQWIAHALALLQSIGSVHDWKPQSIWHGMFAGHLMLDVH
jgi:hypothetical protein